MTTPPIASSVGFKGTSSGATVWTDNLKKVNGDDWEIPDASEIALIQDDIVSILASISALDTTVSNLTITVAGKEPAITAGTTSQYWRGDKSWQTLNQAAIAGLAVSDSPTFAGATLTPSANGQSVLRINQANGTRSISMGSLVDFPAIPAVWLGSTVPANNNYALLSDGVAETSVNVTGGGAVYLKVNNSNALQATVALTTIYGQAMIGGTGGPRLKNNSGETQIRNNADSGYGDLRGSNLWAEASVIAATRIFPSGTSGAMIQSSSGTLQVRNNADSAFAPITVSQINIGNNNLNALGANANVLILGNSSNGNCIVFSQQHVRTRSDGSYSFASTTNAETGSADTTISRASAGVVQIGTTTNNALGSLNLANITASGNVTASSGNITGGNLYTNNNIFLPAAGGFGFGLSAAQGYINFALGAGLFTIGNNTGSTGVTLNTSSGSLIVRNLANNADAAITASNITASGQILTANGTSSAPGFAFSSNAISGFYLPTSNYIGVTTGNIVRAMFGPAAAGTAVNFLNAIGLGNSPATTDPDVILFRDAAGALALRNGTNPQVFRVYGSYINASTNHYTYINTDSGIGYIGTSGTAGTNVSLHMITQGSGAQLYLRSSGGVYLRNQSASAATFLDCGDVYAATVLGATIGINGGNVFRNESGIIAAKLANDSDYADFKARNITTTGTVTAVSTATNGGMLLSSVSGDSRYKGIWVGSSVASPSSTNYSFQAFDDGSQAYTFFNIPRATGFTAFRQQNNTVLAIIDNRSVFTQTAFPSASEGDTLARVSILNSSATQKGLVVRGAAAQTANLQEWQDNASTPQAYIQPNGGIFTNEHLRGSTGMAIHWGTNGLRAYISATATGKLFLSNTTNYNGVTLDFSTNNKLTIRNGADSADGDFQAGALTAATGSFDGGNVAICTGSDQLEFKINTTGVFYFGNFNTPGGSRVGFSVPGNVIQAFDQSTLRCGIGGTGGHFTSNSPTALLEVRGKADEVQLQVRSHSTQTTNPFELYNTAGSLVAAISSAGVPRFGTHSAIAAETVTGYITIKDSGGTDRKIAVVS